jgi:hypothetical protein
LNPILLAGFGAYGHTPAIISGGIPKEEVGAYPSGVINRFFDANVVISVPVAYAEPDCTGVPTDWNAVG